MFKRAVLASTMLALSIIVTSPVRAQSCTAPAGWFPKTPAPLNQQPSRLCDFYLWAWQTFLFVTQDDAASGDNRPRFLTYDTPSDLFGPQVALAFPPSARLANGAQTLLRLAPRVEKQQEPVDVSDILQATSRGILVDQGGRAVYYQIHLNEKFSKFVKDNGFADRNKLKEAKADLPFPVGVVEFKSSWRVLGPNENAKGAFTTRAQVPRLINKDGKIVTDPNQVQEETVALVGLHVVGVIEGHPEFIWATFEHIDNAPDLPKGLNPNSPTPVDNSRSWTFYPKGTPAANSNKRILPPQLTLDQGTQVLKPSTSVFREFAFGGSTDIALITGLTNSVHQQLPAALDIWKNYFLVGAIWLANPAQDFKPGQEFKDPGKLAGEQMLSNSTMETFTQDARPHCFRCHDTTSVRIPGGDDEIPAKLLNVSHVFVKAFSDIQQVIQRAINNR